MYDYLIRINESALIFFVANQIDSGSRAITMEEGRGVVETLGGTYAEMSCKTGDGVNDLIEAALRQAMSSTLPFVL